MIHNKQFKSGLNSLLNECLSMTRLSNFLAKTYFWYISTIPKFPQATLGGMKQELQNWRKI